MVKVIHSQDKMVRMFRIYERKIKKIDDKIDECNEEIDRLEMRRDAVWNELTNLLVNRMIDLKCPVCGKVERYSVYQLWHEWTHEMLDLSMCELCKAESAKLVNQAVCNTVKTYLVDKYGMTDVRIVTGLKSIIGKIDGITWVCSTPDEFEMICEKALKYERHS